MRARARRVLVVVHNDRSIYENKGRFPVQNLEQRMENLRSTGLADDVVSVTAADPSDALEAIIDRHLGSPDLRSVSPTVGLGPSDLDVGMLGHWDAPPDADDLIGRFSAAGFESLRTMFAEVHRTCGQADRPLVDGRVMQAGRPPGAGPGDRHPRVPGPALSRMRGRRR